LRYEALVRPGDLPMIGTTRLAHAGRSEQIFGDKQMIVEEAAARMRGRRS
jgi:hypothetical protein